MQCFLFAQQLALRQLTRHGFSAEPMVLFSKAELICIILSLICVICGPSKPLQNAMRHGENAMAAQNSGNFWRAVPSYRVFSLQDRMPRDVSLQEI